jgi:hypothetical protein
MIPKGAMMMIIIVVITSIIIFILFLILILLNLQQQAGIVLLIGSMFLRTKATRPQSIMEMTMVDLEEIRSNRSKFYLITFNIFFFQV